MGRVEVETPDHVVLRYDLAGGGNRGFAAVVAVLIAALVWAGSLWGYTTVAERIGVRAVQLYGVLVLLTFAMSWSYFVLLEWLWQVQTIGKRMYVLRVIRDDGAAAGLLAVLIRNLLRLVDFLPAFYGLGLLTLIVTSRSQRLGDIAAA